GLKVTLFTMPCMGEVFAQKNHIASRKIAYVVAYELHSLSFDGIVQFQFRVIMPQSPKIGGNVMTATKVVILGSGYFVKMRLHFLDIGYWVLVFRSLRVCC